MQVHELPSLTYAHYGRAYALRREFALWLTHAQLYPDSKPAFAAWWTSLLGTEVMPPYEVSDTPMLFNYGREQELRREIIAVIEYFYHVVREPWVVQGMDPDANADQTLPLWWAANAAIVNATLGVE